MLGLTEIFHGVLAGDDVTHHVFERFPGSLQVVQVGRAGFQRRVVQILEGGSVQRSSTLRHNTAGMQ